MNILSRIVLKATDRDLYDRKKLEERSQQFISQAYATRIDFPVERKPFYSFKHSGNSGDIIYALPSIYTLAEGSPADLYLNLNKHLEYSIVRGRHPLINVTLNQAMFSMLRPLLMSQPEINRCEIYNGNPIDYDLDVFRESPFPLNSGSIARWYFLHFAINADLGKPWLHVKPNNDVADRIVIARSLGYHSPGIDYSFLRKYGKKILFVGVQEEFVAMRKAVPNLEFRPVSDFLELAEIIAGCRFFIGNQSFPFSIAEALKVRRVLEVCYHCPNVIVEGGDGYDFCYQPQFERIVDKLVRQW
ncbi:MAG TPA: hypothetical protein VN367_10185 [Chlorobaculum sp.]|nr:hypothetical protein [Chlorobaculum sp.]